MGRDIHMFIECKEDASSSWTFVGPYWYSKYSKSIVPMEVMSDRDYDMFDWLSEHSDGILKKDDMSNEVREEYDRWSGDGCQWEIRWMDFKSMSKVKEMYDSIPDVVFKDLKPFGWDDIEWYDDDSLNDLESFRREKMFMSSFVTRVGTYVDDLELYSCDRIRVVWWIDC